MGVRETERPSGSIVLLGIALSFTLLGVILPFAVLRATLEEAYRAGPLFSPYALGGFWLVLLATSVFLGVRGRHVAVARGLLIGSVASVAFILGIIAVFLLRNS